jgi:hypothetical protein
MAKTNNTYAKIVAHAWKDARFREKLLKNPKEALKEMGMDVPANFDVRVIEEKTNTMTFILPKAPAQSRELSEQELQKLAGGGICDNFTTLIGGIDNGDGLLRTSRAPCPR